MNGTVLWGQNNIFYVRTGQDELQCRIKGKRLQGEEDYNPLAPGDDVTIQQETEDSGLIIERLPRINAFQRWNKKRKAHQTIAANIDILLGITSIKKPPFRPRFIDRILVSCYWSEIEPVILVNKSDYSIESNVKERINDYKKHYKIFLCSAQTGEGFQHIRSLLSGKRAVLIGQSGTGKSTLINRLNPLLNRRIGDISSKYNRGKHTTNFSVLLEWKKDSEIIDTPGIREIDLTGIPEETIRNSYKEFIPFSEYCSFTPCTHTHEPQCGVKEGVEEGKIHPDRYQSYLNIISK